MRIVLEVELEDEEEDTDVDDLCLEIEEGLRNHGITATAFVEED